MASQVAGVRFVQFVVPHPLVELMVICADLSLRVIAEQGKDTPASTVDNIVELRAFLKDVQERPQAYPVTGRMATSLKKRARR